MVHLHSRDDSDEEEHHHVSIASLRSKFENLAHGHVHTHPPGKVTAATIATTTAPSSTQLPAAPRIPTAAPTTSVSVPATPGKSTEAQEPITGKTTDSSRTAAMSIASAHPQASRPGLLTEALLSQGPSSAPPSTPPVLPPSEGSRPAVVSIPPGTPDEEETFQSVKELRERFGKQSVPKSSPPPPVQPLRRPTVDTGSNVDMEAKAASAQVLNRQRPPPPPKPVPSKSMSLGPSVIKTSLPTLSHSPPSAEPSPPTPMLPGVRTPLSRSQSPALSETQVSASPRSGTPLGSRPAPPPPPLSGVKAQLTSSTKPSRSPSPAAGARPPPPPPPPLHRSASPDPPDTTAVTPARPPLPVRKATLGSSASEPSMSSFSTMTAPPPIPGNRPPPSSSPPAAPPPLPSSARPSVSVPASPPPAPPLPTSQRPSIVQTSSNSSAALPPPLLRTGRPVDVPATSPGPPPLPSASKRPGVSESAPATSPLPPPPVRRPTLPGSSPPPPSAPPLPASKPAAPSASPAPEAVSYRPRAQTTSTVERVSTPTRRADRLGSAVSLEDGYQPPPPPLRGVAQAVVAAGTLARRSTTSNSGNGGSATTPRKIGNGTGDSDEEEEGAGAQPMTTMAQRLLDEHPDSTHANRRPPQFSPHVKLYCSSISAFAVSGRYACVAHHNVRVYDTQMPEQPILTFDQRDTGMEMRVKEPRVTALGFRPSKNKDDKSRYLWCGNRDGHLWELDIRTGEVTGTKPSVHAGAITQIMHHQMTMITLDEVGKLNVWEIIPGGDTFKLTRTLRISDKITFAKMIKGQLWTATAPAVRSTTAATGARGPTVRVYDLVAPGSTPPPLMALTTEWTGAATSATVMPLDPDMVYIGHEGGFISKWTAFSDALVCQQVLKVSSNDILCIEGVGDRLWAGNRKGKIHVFDIAEKPWITTNIWTAHDEQPVRTLAVSPSSIAATGRFMLWSCARDSLIAWDGLLAVDWIDKQMVERQPEYCTFREGRALICSWNIDSCKPTDLVGSVENTSFLDSVLNSVDSPDIIIFGFQEVVPLGDKKLTAKTLLFGHKGREGGGATSDRVSERYRAWADKLTQAVRMATPPTTAYVKVHSEQLVGLFMCVFVKQSERDALRDVNITTVKRGIGGIYGNKGAIVARMVMDDTSMCFINVHLAAGQSHRAARTADLAAIMEDKAIFPPSDKQPYVNGGDGTGILDHEMVVLNGDLNYRIDQRREVVVSCVKSGDFDFLLEHDQLRKEMRANHAFGLRNFEEAPITFAPTYKYDPGTNNYDSSDKRRIPAWCDRILFLRGPRVQPLNYQRYEITTSDHKPVSAALALQLKRIDPTLSREVYRSTLADWKKREGDMLAKISAAYAALY